MDWVHAGRLVSLRKPGDIDDQDDATRAAERNIRPIGLVSIFMRLIGSVAAKQFAGLFAANFDPEDWEGDWTPINVGVAAPGGMQQIQHTVVELMTSNPDWGVLQIDACAAFQECSRRVFLQRIARVWPGAYRWARRCYVQPFPRYVRMEDGSVRWLWSSCGTTQGDPLGPVDHNFALDELLKDLGSRVDGALLYYLDDGTICGPVAQLARMMRLLTEEGGEFEFTARTGMRLNIPKCSVWVLDATARLSHPLAHLLHAADFGVCLSQASGAGRAALLEQHQASLLLPLRALASGCRGCGVPDAHEDPLHFASCPCGIRASDALHHPLRDVVADMLRSVHGHARVRVEPADWRIYSSVKRPDIVVIDARGPGRHLIIDIKTVDPTGRTRLATDHTDEMALGGLVECLCVPQ
ncbi:hypothetical protein AB1Y20_012232 [Prymnesium parvum]|uniref:Reverse transcriptase domain-containing protein n=1 Tax=Prymnesium parvum TaxID=97485 RepID=A0AB34IQ02_PRYPA